MAWISRAVAFAGLILLVHACYSAQEHATLTTTLAQQAASHQATKSSLPLDISIEAVVGTLLVSLGLVLGSPKPRPIRWNVWAGKIEREGEAGFQTNSGEVEKDFRGNPFKTLESRPGFVDIRKQRQEFADWVKSNK